MVSDSVQCIILTMEQKKQLGHKRIRKCTLVNKVRDKEVTSIQDLNGEK